MRSHSVFSAPSKMDANKKRKITFKDGRQSKFVSKFKFFYLKFCYQWCVACLANFSKGVTVKKWRTTRLTEDVYPGTTYL